LAFPEAKFLSQKALRIFLAALAGLAVVGSLGLSACALGLRSHLEQATPPSEYAWISAQNRALATELTRLQSGLGDLEDALIVAQGVSVTTRRLVGLGPRPMPAVLGADPACATTGPMAESVSSSALALDEMLRHSRVLCRSFGEIVDRMESQSQEWACLPSTRPVPGARVTSVFGLRRDPFTGRLSWHEGMDFSVPFGTPVITCAEGRVVRASWVSGYGRLVEVDHGNGLHTLYAHNSRLCVREGDWVSRGETLAYSGASGRASAPHVHYEVRLHGKPVNPEPYILPDPLLTPEPLLARDLTTAPGARAADLALGE
jgi:murein DD-endopeptidase MepM/ murein hydrolase activator NlpD